MEENNSNKELIVTFLEEGFRLDFEMIEGKVSKKRNTTLEAELYKKYLDNSLKMLFYFGFTEYEESLSTSMKYLYSIATKYIKALTKTPDIEFTRENTVLTPTNEDITDILSRVPFVIGQEYIKENWIKNIYIKLSEVFTKEINDYTGTVGEFLLEHNSELNPVGRVFFHLVENKSEEYPFAFLATYSTGDSKNKKVSHTPLKNALLEYKGQNDMLLKLLSTVSKAAQRSDLISEFVESGELFSPLKLTIKEAYTLLKEIPLYEDCGILCRIPNWWRRKSNSLKLSLKVGEQEPSKVGMDALLSFDPQLFLGDEIITQEEIKELLAQTAGLHFIKGKWVEVDHQRLKSTLEAYEKAQALSEGGAYSMAEAMRMQLKASELLDIKDKDIDLDISNGQWLEGIISKLTKPSLIDNISVSEDFKATLRGYQQKGFDWLNYMKNLGFGACLADDMGLGKTVQIIALLEHMRVTTKSRSLLIIPASLIGNWQKEIEKFAPKLKYKIIHGTKEKIDLENIDTENTVQENKDDINLYITTYGMAVRREELKQIKWDLVILDEAQAIKNPGTKQTKAVKELKANFKIAMTGTPIENSLSDLWSLFDFLNAGLLGTAKEFSKIIEKLKNNNADYQKLRTVVNPFILRRLKTDKTIITDLPEKIEMKTYTSLTKKQIMLYNQTLKEIEAKLEKAEGIERKGLVLASIIKFKQICNHPDQYLGQDAFKLDHSGKFERLRDICQTIYEKRERVLIFTQFKEMTTPISNLLEIIFNRQGLVLHGETPVKKRGELVDQFCGEEYIPYMVLSLKAGGVGLNLTAANHVIHFDRWWNPAVENQATDRAFRIGQQKNVMVHKFITSGTIEEKIDIMIEEKMRLAEDIIAESGGSWITELDNKQLIELFKLV